MNKKNLDTLFQDKFKDFKEKPDEKVWESIEASLDKKKNSHRVIPLWWKLGGIAAVLALLFYVVGPGDQSNPEQEVIITDMENTDSQDVEGNKEKNVLEETIDNQGAQIQVTDADVKDTIDPVDASGDKEPAIADSQNNTSDFSSSDTDQGKNEVSTKNITSGTTVADTQKDPALHRAVANNADSKANSNILAEDQGEAMAVTLNNPEDGKAEKMDAEQLAPPLNDTLNQEANEGIAEITEDEVEELKKQDDKKSIFDEIEAQQDEELIAEAKGSKWSAGPSIAPVYYNAIGEGSPVHSIFVPNSKSGDINLSYGLTVAYEISDRLSIRSGVHRVDFGYDTNDVEFSSSLQAAGDGQIDNIDYTLTSKTLVVQSKANGISNTVAEPEAALLDVAAQNPARSGSMAQNFGYLEVPVELNYALVDRKFGINIIGGVSSLFLVDNAVTLSSDGLTTEMGEANNVNSVNFSTNVGFGVNYRFTSKLRFNVEPIFKYQLNTFSETAGNFQPFSVGVYSGLSFKF